MECGQQVRHGRRRYSHNSHNHPRQSQRNGYGATNRQQPYPQSHPYLSRAMSLKNPDSLLDICAKKVARHIPFVHIEERYQNRIPEPVQERIIFWSFPTSERDICMYSSMSTTSIPLSAESNPALSIDTPYGSTSPFHKGVKLYESDCVSNVLQVGFHLSGEVSAHVGRGHGSSNLVGPEGGLPPGYTTLVEDSSPTKYKVSVNFDRCKIKSVTCSCDTRDIFWCQHVVALSIYRIRKAEQVRLRVPISETLLQMDRFQLQKLVQYLITEHHTDVLPTAQKLADEILRKKSDINRIQGAPDPTAGSDAADQDVWHFDETQVRDQVKTCLAQGGYYNANKQLVSMFSKVREMLRARDLNGARMLTLITEQFLADPRLILWRSQGTVMADKCRLLWDQLGSLWVSVVLNPDVEKGGNSNGELVSRLRNWSKSDVCPWEDPDYRHSNGPSGTQNVFPNQETQLNQGHHPHNHQRSHGDNSEQHEPTEEASSSAGWTGMIWASQKRRPILGPDPCYSCPALPGDRVSRRSSNGGQQHPSPARTVFSKALDAVAMRWDDPQLVKIMRNESGGPVTPDSATAPYWVNEVGQMLWQEHIPTACARVDALKTHGHDVEAVRLAVAVVRTMKYNQLIAYTHWQQQQHNGGVPTQIASGANGGSPVQGASSKGLVTSNCYTSWEGWIGHSLNPIGCLFETLAEACVVPEDKSKLATMVHHHSDLLSHGEESPAASSVSTVPAQPPSLSAPPRHYHAPAPSTFNKRESLLTLAVEAAVIGLGQQRVMPYGLYAQEKSCKQEERLIARLQEVMPTGGDSPAPDANMTYMLRHQANLLLEMGPSSGLGLGIHPESIPMQTFAKFMFAALLPVDPTLAYKVGLRSLRLPILEHNSVVAPGGDHVDSCGLAPTEVIAERRRLLHHRHQDTGQAGGAAGPGHQGYHRGSNSFMLSRIPRWYTLGHIEGQQCALVSTMLSSAKGDLIHLGSILEAAQRHIHSSTHLFKLAQDAFRYAELPPSQSTPGENSSIEVGQHHPHDHKALLNVAFQLGLQVMRNTRSSLNWRRRDMVRWLVTCATEVGSEAILSLLQNWKRLFNPTEATGLVATTIMSNPTVVKLNLDYGKQEELTASARSLALQCAHDDPSNCALNALTLCESDAGSFEAAYQIVLDAAAHAMTFSQLFTVARYMEHKGYPKRAFKLALMAMQIVQVTANQDNHPAINDIHWACALSHSLGKSELTAFIPTVVKNIACATVLSDILRRCSMTMGLPELTRQQPQGVDNALSYDRPPLKHLLESTIAAYVTTTHSKLSSISPRHYTEFVDFLTKAKETFMLSGDGPVQFSQLIDNMKMAYKGKKKLVCLIKEKFG